MDLLIIARAVSILSATVLEISARMGLTEVEVPSLAKLKENIKTLDDLIDLPTEVPGEGPSE